MAANLTKRAAAAEDMKSTRAHMYRSPEAAVVDRVVPVCNATCCSFARVATASLVGSGDDVKASCDGI